MRYRPSKHVTDIQERLKLGYIGKMYSTDGIGRFPRYDEYGRMNCVTQVFNTVLKEEVFLQLQLYAHSQR